MERTMIAQVACEIEAAEGVAETIVAADVFLAFNPKFTPNIEEHERNPVRTHHGGYPSLFGRRSGRIGFDVEMVGGAAAGDPLHFSDAFRACGFLETLVPATSATYTPATASIPSVTQAFYMDGKVYKIWGARAATCRMVLEDGKPGIISLEYLGADFSVLDGAVLAGTSLSAIVPPVFQGATFTIDSYAALISRLEIDMGLRTAMRPDVNAASGNKSAVITGRRALLKLDPEAVLVATKDFMGTWRAGTEVALSAVWGSGAGSTHTLTAPKVQYKGLTLEDREGIAHYMINAQCNPNAGDDEVQWQIT